MQPTAAERSTSASTGLASPSPEPPDTADQTQRARRATLTFSGGGWVILVTILLCAGILVWALAGVLAGSRPVGDGGDPTTYGFDLEGPDLGGRILVASGNARDFLPALDMPRTAAGRDILEINRAERGKYLVTADRVVGVQIDGVSRAYPLRLLNAHEVCNDELAGVPIAVTYSPLCDSVVVFDRRIGLPDGRTRTARFGVSGLLLDSNLLMYDRDEPGSEDAASGAPRSLWSQILGRAVTGPDAVADDGAPLRLRVIPGVQVVPWSMWLERRPGTSVALRDDASALRIKRIDYGRYWAHGEPIYPLGLGPDRAALAGRGLTLMSPAVRIAIGDDVALLALPEIAAGLPQVAGGEAGGAWSTTLGGRTIRFVFTPDRRAAWIDAPDAQLIHGRIFVFGVGGD